MNEHDDLIQQGAAVLRNAVNAGNVTLDRIRAAQARDVETVRVREYWGDRNQDQQAITQGIKLRIAARERFIAELTPCTD